MLAIKISALLAVSLVFSASHAQVGSVQVITIRSSWGGLGKPGNSEFAIRRENDHFVAGQKSIPAEQVEAFVTAIRQPSIAAPQSANLGITSLWLDNHVEDAGRYATYFNYADGSAEQKNLFRSAFTNEQTLEQRLASIYAGFHTDDYPHMSIDVTLSDGTNLSVTSDSQYPFMLPWKISRGGTTTETYNANISRALWTMLPSKFTNREALTNEEPYVTGLFQELAQHSGNEVKTRWEALGAGYKAGDALASLKAAYQIRRAEVNSHHNLDYGKAWTDGSPHEENLHVDLWRSGFPKNFVLAAILKRENGKVEGADKLAESVASYEQLVLSIPWLKEYWNTHLNEHAWLFYVHDRSFTEKAMEIFAADMKEAKRQDLIAKVRAVQNQAALLETGAGDYWIILPDKSMILWRWQSLSNVLMWKPTTFPVVECTEYGTVTGGCSGASISGNGMILP